MANRYIKRTTLYVEGRDDLFAIANLLKAHAFQMDKPPGGPVRDIEIDEAAKADIGSGREKLMKLVEPAVKASTDKAVGFVMDADKSTAATWDSVRGHIETAVGGIQASQEMSR